MIFLHYSFICVNLLSSSSSLFSSLILSLLSMSLSSSSSFKSVWACDSKKVWHLILLKKKFHCHPHPPPCCPPWCCCRHWHCCCCCHPHHHSRVGWRGRSSRKPQVSIKFRSWEIWKVEQTNQQTEGPILSAGHVKKNVHKLSSPAPTSFSWLLLLLSGLILSPD